MAELESLKAIAAFRLLAHNVQHTVDELGTLGVMTLGPVVSGACLAKDKVVGSEELAEWARSDAVHGTRFQVHQNGTRHVTAASSFVEVDVDALQLENGVSVTVVGPYRWDQFRAHRRSYDLPELGTDLVTTLTTLDMNELTHVVRDLSKRLAKENSKTFRLNHDYTEDTVSLNHLRKNTMMTMMNLIPIDPTLQIEAGHIGSIIHISAHLDDI